MPKKKNKQNDRQASKKLKEDLRDKPFGVSASLSWDDASIDNSDWDGVIDEDDDINEEDDEEYDFDEDFYDDDDDGPQPLEFN